MARLDIPVFEDWIAGREDVVDVVNRVRYTRERRQPLNTVPGYVGAGRDKSVFLVGGVALKILHPFPETPFRQQMSALQRAQGIPHVEQVVTYSERAKVIVTAYIEGTMPAQLHAHELGQYIRPETIEALIEMSDAMIESRVYVEGPSNLLVSDDGITVIDPTTHPENMLTVQHHSQIADLITTYGWRDGHIMRDLVEAKRIRALFRASQMVSVL